MADKFISVFQLRNMCYLPLPELLLALSNLKSLTYPVGIRTRVLSESNTLPLSYGIGIMQGEENLNT